MHPAALPTDGELVRARTLLGEFEITICTDGPMVMDGGSMFGVVPRTMWQQRMPADENNCVLMGLNTAVVRTGRQTIVIETGIGNKQPPKLKAIHQNKELLPASLAAAGVKPEEVDVVINTHLHFDHCGWNTTLQEDGSVTPTFPRARYFAHRGELDHGRLQLDRDKVSYRSPNYDPLLENGQMTLVHGRTATICEGVWMEVYPGHTEQMLAVHIESGGQHACYISDLIPTSNHLDPTWAMGFDLDPLTVIEQRKRFYARAIPEDWLVIFTHDHHVPMARLMMGERGRPVVRTAEGRGFRS